jgi:hypothetical protein
MSGNTKVKAENGIYKFTQINFVAKPDYRSTVKFISSAITTMAEIKVSQKTMMTRNLAALMDF